MADYATLLRDHTTLTCRSVDRIFLQAYVPGLQTPGGNAVQLGRIGMVCGGLGEGLQWEDLGPSWLVG